MANRRLAPHEVALLSPGERAKWYRRNKITPPAEGVAVTAIPGDQRLQPPPWLPARHKMLFHETVASAPPGLLQPIDQALLCAYVGQLVVLEEATADTTLDGRRLARQTAQSLTQLATALCLTPTLRARHALDTPPPKPVDVGPDRWAALRLFPTIHGSKK